MRKPVYGGWYQPQSNVALLNGQPLKYFNLLIAVTSSKEITLDIGQTIRQLRLAYGYTQSEFADIVGLSQSHLSLVEKGKRDLRQDSLERISEAFEMPVAMIMFMSMNEDDVPKSKRELFRRAKPVINRELTLIFPINGKKTSKP